MATNAQMEDLSGGFSTGTQRHTVTLLPDPEPATRYFTIISTDDHLIEPPHLFEGRLPARFADRAPQVVDLDDGGSAWEFEGRLMPNIGLAAAMGRPADEWGTDPTGFDEMRRGVWDPTARLHDMDLDGVYASINFPSFLPGFGGGRMQTMSADRELSLALLRAYNDWHLEEWCGTDLQRFIPLQLAWLHDVELGAEQIRTNAERGFKAVTFPEHPDWLGFPSVFTDHWDPMMRACEETGTVLCLHTGSGGGLPKLADGAPPALMSAVFGSYALIPTCEWLYSMIAARFPEIKIVISEGGLGWVAGLIDRLNHLNRHQANREYYGPFYDIDLTPAELLQRNFYFCAVDEVAAWQTRHTIGVDHLMVEVDYPHPDSVWGETQEKLRRQLQDLPPDEAALVTWGNASRIFDHPVPVEVQADPNAF